MFINKELLNKIQKKIIEKKPTIICVKTLIKTK